MIRFLRRSPLWFPPPGRRIESEHMAVVAKSKFWFLRLVRSERRKWRRAPSCARPKSLDIKTREETDRQPWVRDLISIFGPWLPVFVAETAWLRLEYSARFWLLHHPMLVLTTTSQDIKSSTWSIPAFSWLLRKNNLVLRASVCLQALGCLVDLWSRRKDRSLSLDILLSRTAGRLALILVLRGG